MRPRATELLRRKACSNSSDKQDRSLFKHQVVHRDGTIDRLAARPAGNQDIDVGQLLQDVLWIGLVVHPLWLFDSIERHSVGIHSVPNLEAHLRTNAILQYHAGAPTVEFNGDSRDTG